MAIVCWVMGYRATDPVCRHRAHAVSYKGMMTRPVRFFVLLLLCVFAAAPLFAVEDFLVPGVDLSDMTFETGAWCRYVVTDEALGQTDSTDVYIGVPGSEMTADGRAYWVEIETSLRGADAEDREIMKLLVLETITGFADGDSLGDYVLKLYMKNGNEPAEEEDPRRLRDVSLRSAHADSSWAIGDTLPVATAAGRFRCVKKQRLLENNREIPTGNIVLLRKTRDNYQVWFSRQIPVLHLAKCIIERSRETDTVPRIKGIPTGGVKESKTTAEIVAFGHDARTLVSVGGR